jgi:Arc/MetJ-type ribon-helix-helix transcriptional regulator
MRKRNKYEIPQDNLNKMILSLTLPEEYIQIIDYFISIGLYESRSDYFRSVLDEFLEIEGECRKKIKEFGKQLETLPFI